MPVTDKIIIGYAVLIYMLSGCISEFETPKNMKDMSGILVVEGIIEEEGTKITVTRTVK